MTLPFKYCPELLELLDFMNSQNQYNMKKEIIISGFGGQGVLSMGKILAYSGLMEDKEVTWMPAYGPYCQRDCDRE